MSTIKGEVLSYTFRAWEAECALIKEILRSNPADFGLKGSTAPIRP